MRGSLLTSLVRGLVCLSILWARVSPANAQAPVVTGFSPTEGKPIITRVSIYGTNITQATAVEFNGTPSTNFFQTSTGPNSESLSALVPFGATTGPITVRTSAGSFTTADLFTVPPIGAPVVTNFLPTSGWPGQTVIIEGEDIVEATEILFNGSPARFANFGMFPWLEAMIAFIPMNATTGPITLKTPLGSFTTTNLFMVALPGPPVVDSFSPTSGPPGASVELRGTNFYDVISVAFGGVEQPAGGFMMDLFTVRVGTNAQTGPITVRTAYGSYTTSNTFTVLPTPPPRISWFGPKAGLPGSRVYIPDDFHTLQYVTNVQFNGVSAAFSFFSGAPGFDIFATVPPDATTGPITLISPQGSATSSEVFTVLQQPSLTGIEPDQGPPGTVVQLTGSDLEKVVSVSLNESQVPYDPGTFRFTIPADAASGAVTIISVYGPIPTSFHFEVTHDNELAVNTSSTVTNILVPTTIRYLITVTNRGSTPINGVVLTNFLFRMDHNSPDLDSALFDPASVSKSTNSGITVLSALAGQGSCFVDNQTVGCALGTLHGGTAATVELHVQAERSGVICQVAQAQGAEFDPVPQDNRASTTNIVWGVPMLTDLSPASGTPGTQIEISATNQLGSIEQNNLDQVTEVWFGLTPARFSYDANRFTLTAIVPSNPNMADGLITVVTPGGAVTSPNPFERIPEATLSSLSPEEGPPGTKVQLLGTNLDQIVSMRIGGLTVPFANTDGTYFIVPSDALSGPVTICMPHSCETSQKFFTVTRPLDIGLSETSVPNGVLAPARIDYSIRVANKGELPVRDVVLTNWFFRTETVLNPLAPDPGSVEDGSLVMLSADSSQGRCFVTNRAVRCELGQLEAFAKATIYLAVEVYQPGAIHHFAGVEGKQDDPDPRDDQLHSVTPVFGPKQLTISRVAPRLVEVRWPVSATRLVLQTREQLEGSAWVSFGGSIIEVGSWRTTRDNLSSKGRLYRLLQE